MQEDHHEEYPGRSASETTNFAPNYCLAATVGQEWNHLLKSWPCAKGRIAIDVQLFVHYTAVQRPAEGRHKPRTPNKPGRSQRSCCLKSTEHDMVRHPWILTQVNGKKRLVKNEKCQVNYVPRPT